MGIYAQLYDRHVAHLLTSPVWHGSEVRDALIVAARGQWDVDDRADKWLAEGLDSGRILAVEYAPTVSQAAFRDLQQHHTKTITVTSNTPGQREHWTYQWTHAGQQTPPCSYHARLTARHDLRVRAEDSQTIIGTASVQVCTDCNHMVGTVSRDSMYHGNQAIPFVAHGDNWEAAARAILTDAIRSYEVAERLLASMCRHPSFNAANETAQWGTCEKCSFTGWIEREAS